MRGTGSAARRVVFSLIAATALLGVAAFAVHAAGASAADQPPNDSVREVESETVKLGLGFGDDSFKVATGDVAAAATITADTAAQSAYAIESKDGPLSKAKTLEATLLDWSGTPVWYLQWDGMCLQPFETGPVVPGRDPVESTPPPDPCPDGTRMQALVVAGGKDAGRLMTLGG